MERSDVIKLHDIIKVKDKLYVVEFAKITTQDSYDGGYTGKEIRARKLDESKQYDPKGKLLQFHEKGWPYSDTIDGVKIVGRMPLKDVVIASPAVFRKKEIDLDKLDK